MRILKASPLKLALFVICFSIPVLFHQNTLLLFSRSESLQGTAFLVIKGWPAKKRDLVSFTQAKIGDQIYTKRIKGIVGDAITIKEHVLYIQNQRIGAILPTTSEGKPLSPTHARHIPHGKVFVSGEHDRSFDSRYEEFGLVDASQIIGRTFRLW